MHFGVSVPNNFGVESMRELVEFAVTAEELGYQSAWVSDHLFHASYVAARLGNRPYHEALTVLTAIAARTESVNLGTSVLVLPWHQPVRLAKVLASLDQLSGGRVIVGVGVGNAKDEFEALGVPFEERGRIGNEYLEGMQALWTQSVPTFQGQHLSFDGLRFEPKPAQNPHPPFWIGGNTGPALRRLVRYGNGWHPLRLSPRELAARRIDLHEALTEAGRLTDVPIAVRLQLTFEDTPPERAIEDRKTCSGRPEDIANLIEAYQSAGATHIILDGGSRDLERSVANLRRFREEVAPRFTR
ncbi:MAG: TIGR03619 family F420-dependent LLM class oxidoreductase [Chromatiales bacterium]|jgi:probable F420-dependent oxidoreductase|nr:TIGR03619 family F420-dependent LLM class oxidoreductase [Chromatiales bacterium]